jgi:hypothetical protein
MTVPAPRPTRPPALPRLARRTLPRLSRYDEEFGVPGDLAEEFAVRCRASGRHRAASWYRRQALFAAGSSVVFSIQIGVARFKNVLKIAFRTMLRFKLYSLINLLGLSVGLAVSLLALLYVRYETSYDDFHDRPKDIYRIVTRQLGNVYQGTDWWASSRRRWARRWAWRRSRSRCSLYAPARPTPRASCAASDAPRDFGDSRYVGQPARDAAFRCSSLPRAG